jgi:outer membrane murein-binding lipoprotein Lpp
MKKLALCATLVSIILMSGCASILNEKTQKINVASSNGKPITGTVDGQAFTAPGVVTVTRAKAAKIINVDTAGCAKQTVVDNSVDMKFFINILSGGAFGSTTDYATEKMWKYSDTVVISCSQ